jgi:hypothetical protein
MRTLSSRLCLSLCDTGASEPQEARCFTESRNELKLVKKAHTKQKRQDAHLHTC